jgi:outer membrane protein W
MRRLVLFLLLLPLTATAQTNDVSFFLGGVAFDETTIAAFAPEDFEANLTFENGGALSFSYNHFWRERFSTEFSIIGMASDPTLQIEEGPVDISVDLGDMTAGAITAAGQWHFRTGARVRPYIGGGIALVSGEIEVDFEDEDGVRTQETADLEGKGALLLNGGVNFRISDRWDFAIDAKAIPYSPEVEGDEADENDEIDLNPFILGFGIRYRF